MGFGPWVNVIRATLDEIRVFLLYVFCLKIFRFFQKNAIGPVAQVVRAHA